MEKSTRKKIEFAFYNYKKLMESAVTSTVEIADANMAVDYSKVVVKSSTTNKKESKICDVIDKSLTAYRWCMVVEKVLDYYKWDCKEKLIRKRYFEKKGTLKICLEIGISERTFKYWKDDILLRAFMWAKELNLINKR